MAAMPDDAGMRPSAVMIATEKAKKRPAISPLPSVVASVIASRRSWLMAAANR